MKTSTSNNLAVLLSGAANIIKAHPHILYPLCLYAFLQLFVLEILYFSPRFPLSAFFGPLITTLWGGTFLHYPFNFILLPKLFYYIQVPLYLFLGAFLSATAVTFIAAVNDEKKIQ